MALGQWKPERRASALLVTSRGQSRRYVTQGSVGSLPNESPRQTSRRSKRDRRYDAPVTRVGYLGPHGTFAEEALLTQPDLAAAESVPLRSVPHVINAVEQGDVDL